MYKIFRLNKLLTVIITLALILLLVVVLVPKRVGAVDEENCDEVCVPIFMYHSILKDKSRQGKYIISPEDFEADLQYLSENGYTTVVMQDLIDYVYNKTPLPEKPVIISFDDGYYNNYTYAYPLLEKYDAKIVISIVGTYTDLYTKTPDMNPYYAHMNWEVVDEMLSSGRIEFQNHSYNLHQNTSKRNGAKKARGESLDDYTKLLTDDLMLLQKKFKDNCSYEPTTFTYPYGAVSDASVEIIKNLGFTASLSCAQKINIIKQDDPDCLYRLNRFIRTHSASVKSILE